MVTSEQSFPPQIRILDNSTDLLEVADLIETCFAEHMDADGYEYLNHIRKAARDTRFLRWVPGAGEMASYPLHGYVWVEDDMIIGNLTLIPVYVQNHWNYLIVNVAVNPDYRGQGIARQLTLKGLEHIQSHGAYSAWLQVRDDNPAAIHLYQSLGFIERARRTTWYSDQFTSEQYNMPGISITSRKKNEWPLHKQWLNRCYPEHVSWHLPISVRKYSPSFINRVENFFSDQPSKHITCYYQGKPIGFATIETTLQSADLIWLAVGHDFEEMAVKALLSNIRKNMTVFRPFTINYASEFPEDIFLSNGFTRQNTLIWMEISFQSVSIPFLKRVIDRLITL